jgi:hypothetical protein
MKRSEFFNIICAHTALQVLQEMEKYRDEMKIYLPDSKDDIDNMYDLAAKIFADNVNDMKKLVDAIPFEAE